MNERIAMHTLLTACKELLPMAEDSAAAKGEDPNIDANILFARAAINNAKQYTGGLR